MQDLKEDHTQGPYIAFTRVLLPSQDLERHVERRPHATIDGLVRAHLPRKTEISQFQSPSLTHDIGWFEVPVYDSFSNQSKKPIAKLFQHLNSLLLVPLLSGQLPLGDFFLQVPITQLSDEIVVLTTLQNIMQFNDII